MKKRFTLILASMLLTMGAWAQLADGVYTIKNVINNRGTLVAVDGQTNVGAADITLSGYEGKSETAMTDGDKWYISTVDDNVFLYNVANGKFLNSRQGDPVQFTETPVTGFTLTANGDYYVIAHGNYKVSCCPGYNKAQTVRWLTADESASQHLTFTLVESGTTTFADQITAANEAITELLSAVFSFNYISGTNATNTWSEALDVYPAGLSNEIACGGSKGNSAQHIGADGHSVHKAVSAINATGSDLTVTFQYTTGLGNQAHAISTLGVDVVNANGEVVASDYHLGFSGGDTYSNVYTLSGLAAGNYILRYYVCNKSGDHDLNSTSGTITVTGAKEITEAATVSDMLTTLTGKVPTAKGEGLGYYDTAETEAAETLAETEVTGDDVAPYVAAFVALDDAIDGITFYTPVPGKFYRLQGKASGNYMNALTSTPDTDTKMDMASDENRDAAGSVFYLTENSKLLSYKLGTYLKNTHNIGAMGETNGNTIYFNPSESGNGGYFTLKTDYSGSKYIYDNNTKVDRTSSYVANNCEWKVEEVTELSVTIGAVGYATLHAPVALTVPTGVKAYTGTLNGEWLTLNKVSTTIPANTAVILEGAANTYNFAMTDDVDAIEGNNLVGTIEAVAKTGTVYTLQSHDFDGDGVKEGIAFKQYTGTNLTGFKAYLAVESQVQAIRIRKGTTGIENSELNVENSAVIYDLLGRRVEKMEKGIYIVNGKKIIK